jgi:hypothetical protein
VQPGDPRPAITRAAITDRRSLIDDLLAAFVDDPVLCWVFPDPSARQRYGRHFFAMQDPDWVPLLDEDTVVLLSGVVELAFGTALVSTW